MAVLNDLWPKFDAFVRGWAVSRGISINTTKRQKSYFSIMNKLNLFINKKKPLSSLSDVLGYRIIINGPKKDNKASIAACYSVLNALIWFFSVETEKPSCSFLAAEKRNGEELSPDLAKEMGICIPARANIMEYFANNVKDYIRHPKINGYQALHLFVELEYRQVIEVQIRTSAMNSYAERGDSPASHIVHKHERYDNPLLKAEDVDFSRLHIKGVSKDLDEVALIKSVPSFIGIPN